MIEDIFTDNGDTLTRGDVRVNWVELGEGWSGDYDEEDSEDEELLRFDLQVRIRSELGRGLDPHEVGYYCDSMDEVIDSLDQDEEWLTLENGSYCTRFPAASGPGLRKAGLLWLMNKLEDPITDRDWKRAAEEASWIEPAWLETEGGIPE